MPFLFPQSRTIKSHASSTQKRKKNYIERREESKKKKKPQHQREDELAYGRAYSNLHRARGVALTHGEGPRVALISPTCRGLSIC